MFYDDYDKEDLTCGDCGYYDNIDGKYSYNGHCNLNHCNTDGENKMCNCGYKKK